LCVLRLTRTILTRTAGSLELFQYSWRSVTLSENGDRAIGLWYNNCMIKNTIQVALMGAALVCPPSEPTLPDRLNTPCPAFQAVLMQYWDPETLTCNPDGNQILVTTIDDDPGPTQQELCDHAGGQVLYDPDTDRFYCVDIDY